MTRTEAKTIIKSLIATKRRMAFQFSILESVIGSSPESPLNTAVWKCFDEYCACVEKLVSTEDSFCDSLSWYIWENDCGKKALSHSLPVTGKMKTVKNTDDLLDVLGYAKPIKKRPLRS